MTEQSKKAAQHAEEKMFLELEEECARLHAEIERLRAQRDQLLAALQRIYPELPFASDLRFMACAAIAAVEEKP